MLKSLSVSAFIHKTACVYSGLPDIKSLGECKVFDSLVRVQDKMFIFVKKDILSRNMLYTHPIIRAHEFPKISLFHVLSSGILSIVVLSLLNFSQNSSAHFKSLYISYVFGNLAVYEEFKLRQGAATKLVGNKFITCEVIGVIKLYCQLNRCVLIPLPPYTKEYCGFSREPSNTAYKAVHTTQKITEHVRDAYRLLKICRAILRGGTTMIRLQWRSIPKSLLYRKNEILGEIRGNMMVDCVYNACLAGELSDNASLQNIDDFVPSFLKDYQKKRPCSFSNKEGGF